MIEHLSMLLLLLLLLLLIFVWRIKEMVRSREESIGGKPAASQPLCVWVFVGHLRMYYKCGVRLFKHPAHDYLINCLTEFIFIKFFSSFVFFHRFYSLFVTFTLLFLRSNIWRRKKIIYRSISLSHSYIQKLNFLFALLCEKVISVDRACRFVCTLFNLVVCVYRDTYICMTYIFLRLSKIECRKKTEWIIS